MKIAKTVAGLVAVSLFAFLAACGGGKDTPGTAGTAASTTAAGSAGSPGSSGSVGSGGSVDGAVPGTTASPAERFKAALARTGGATHKFSVKFADGAFSGGVDPAGHVTAGKITVPDPTTTMVIETLITDAAYYVRISGLPLPGVDSAKWQKVDPKKITGKTLISFGETHDPTGLKVVSGDLVKVESSDGRQFKGTLDLTKKAWGPLDADVVSKLGDAGKAVPFEATVDDKGNLTALKIKQPAVGSDAAAEFTATYSDFGVPVAATPPAASAVIDAPEIVYTLLNSE